MQKMRLLKIVETFIDLFEFSLLKRENKCELIFSEYFRLRVLFSRMKIKNLNIYSNLNSIYIYLINKIVGEDFKNIKIFSFVSSARNT
jgi:hypothetical protein